jgi:hypothetical protein
MVIMVPMIRSLFVGRQLEKDRTRVWPAYLAALHARLSQNEVQFQQIRHNYLYIYTYIINESTTKIMIH